MTRTHVPGTSAVIMAGLVLATCAPAVAQEAGNRVRGTIGGNVLTGDVVATGDAGFTLARPEEGTTEVLSGEVERLEVRTCCPGYVWVLATVFGASVGGMLEGYVRGDVLCRKERPWLTGGYPHTACSVSPGDVVLGSLAGGAAGLPVGRRHLRDRWATIPITKAGGPEVGPLVEMRSGGGNPRVVLGALVRF